MAMQALARASRPVLGRVPTRTVPGTRAYQAVTAGAYCPHPDKQQRGGEDAGFIRSHTFAVADGVGGWADAGVDPGVYSRQLMHNCGELAQQYFEEGKVDPGKVLSEAYKAMPRELKGSCTICMLSFDERMHVCNFGDSGYALFRLNEADDETPALVYASTAMTKSFNFPLQLGSVGDPITAMQLSTLEVQAGDVIVTATDGLWDNVFVNKMAELLAASELPATIEHVLAANAAGDEADELGKELAEVAMEAAVSLASEAITVGLDKYANSPFMQEAKLNRLHFRGGKLDDTYTMVSVVVPDELGYAGAVQPLSVQ